MRDLKWDQMKTMTQMKRDHGKTCKVCDKPVSHMQGSGSSVLCRDHQLEQPEYGGMGRIDRPHTFHRTWCCSECGWEPLKDPRLADIKDELEKRMIGRILMQGDHIKRKSEGGLDTAENVKSLCVVCHAKKTVKNKDYISSKYKQLEHCQ